ncbi:MAG: Trm112 family protein [Gemmatimonadales bacterium]
MPLASAAQMFVELLDRLRCPNRHEDMPLVATASRTVDRHIVEGTLGCPVCGAEYRVHGGAVEFGDEAHEPGAIDDAIAGERTLRLGALLGLDDRGGLYVVDFSGARLVKWLAELSPLSQFIAFSGGDAIEGAGVVIRGRGGVLPLARACARGVALDDPSPGLLRSAVDALVPGGRLVAPAEAAVPGGIALLARDDEQWVGEREAVPALTVIRRR